MYYLLNGNSPPVHEAGKEMCGEVPLLLLSFIVPFFDSPWQRNWQIKRSFMSFVSRWRRSFENWDSFQPNPLCFPIFLFEKKFSVFLFADNLLLYLGRWDVDVAIGREIEGKKEKEKS